MNDDTLLLRDMTRAELDTALEWALGEGWNIGSDDANLFHSTDPGGFVVGTLGGRPVGSISAVRYEEHFAFIGLFVVVPELRGRGHGRKIWAEAMQRTEGRLVGLDSVTARQHYYERSGFAAHSLNVCMQGTARGGAAAHPCIKPISKLRFDALRAFDRRHFPADRTAFLEALVRTPRSHSFAYLQDGAIEGYGVIRPCRDGWKVGPLFATSEGVAESLLQALEGSVPEGEKVSLLISAACPGSAALARRHGMSPLFETVRMYKGRAPRLDEKGIFGVSGFELG
jgi:GNAT superfamily N-acetyltransferase